MATTKLFGPSVILLLGVLLSVGCSKPCTEFTFQDVGSSTCTEHTPDGVAIWTIHEFTTSDPMSEWECQYLRFKRLEEMHRMGKWEYKGREIIPAAIAVCKCVNQ